MSASGDVFNPNTMEEKIKIGDHELILKPLKLKTFRVFVGTIDSAVQRMQAIDPKSTNAQVIDSVLQYSGAVFQALFPPETYPFMTQEFIEENMSIPLMRHVLARAVAINQVEDMFPFLKQITPPAA